MDANTVYEMVMGAITIYEAKQYISQKLHKSGEEDPDVELIINHMFDICRIISIKMFEYGAKAV